MVVSDTSPLNYLVLIEQINILAMLYGRVFIPQSVYEELNAPETPEPVRAWRADLPRWLEISSERPAPDTGLSSLHAGERDAISLALHLQAGALIIDERRGREEAEKRGLKVIGTVGVIASAHESGLLDLIGAFDRLRQTTFHVSPKLLAAILRKYQSTAEEESQSE
jgi:predicted nucleic acid-binding protein